MDCSTALLWVSSVDCSTALLWVSSVWICIYILHLLLLARGAKNPKHNLPPGPNPLPIVGNLFKLGDKPNESLAALAKTYGPLMTLKLGSVTTVVVSSAEMAKEVLHKNAQLFAGRTVPDVVRALGHGQSSVVWLPADSTWRNLRKICNTQMFTTERLDASQSLRCQKVNDLVAYVRQSCRTGDAVDIGRAAFVTTLNLLTNMFFSFDMVDINSKSAQEFKELVWQIMEVAGKPNLSDFFPLLKPLDAHGLRRCAQGCFGKLHKIFDRIIDERLKSRGSSSTSQTTNDFLDALLDQSHQNVEFGRQYIKALLVDMFCAGTDTSSSTLEWAMAELLKNPVAMSKARKELAETIGSKQEVEESDIAKFPLLQAVVRETLRLHPPVPLLLPHRAEASVELCGFTVPKHTQVLVNAWAIGRDGSIWEDPSAFTPERFLDSDVDFRGRNFELIPFGAGLRICPGLPLAFRMVHLMLASLLHSFTWRLPDGMSPKDLDMSDKIGLTSAKAQPLMAVPVQL